jgi:hypothetical protein
MNRAREGVDRGVVIDTWLSEYVVGGYVIIDDHVDMGALRTHLVLTHAAHGDVDFGTEDDLADGFRCDRGGNPLQPAATSARGGLR